MRDPVGERFEALFGPEFGHGKPFDLEPLHRVLDALGGPQFDVPPVIHVAGTNGKGSTIAFLRAILETDHLVHAFTKPHLFTLRERFLAGSDAPSEALLIDLAESVAALGGSGLTQFDAQVAVAAILFCETQGDVVLLETGLGGRDDSTAVFPPALCIITPIGLDHQDVLGTTLAEIATHKAGIMKPGVPSVVARQPVGALEVIEARAAEIGAPLLRCGVEWDAYASHGRLLVQSEDRALDVPLPALHGAHQIDNAGLACAALMLAAPKHIRPMEDAAFAQGVANATWPARLQPLTRGMFSAPIRAVLGEVWVDGGHNAHAAQALSHALEQMKARRGGTNVAIVGLRRRKDALTFVSAIAAGAEHIIAVPLTEDHVSVHEMAALGDKLGREVATAPSLAAAMQNAAQLPAPRVLICGSFLLAAEALAAESV